MTQATQSKNEEPTKARRILVVDDDESVLQLVTKFLKKRGHEVHSCPTGEECLVQLARFAPDVVLLDFNLPGMNGLQTLQKIRACESGNKTTVVLVTAQTDKDLVKSSLQLGIDDFLVKPFSLEAMASRLEKHFLDIDTDSVREMLKHLPVIDETLIDQLPIEEALKREKRAAYPLFREGVLFAFLLPQSLSPSAASRLESAELISHIQVYVKRTQWKQVWPSPDLKQD